MFALNHGENLKYLLQPKLRVIENQIVKVVLFLLIVHNFLIKIILQQLIILGVVLVMMVQVVVRSNKNNSAAVNHLNHAPILEMV
jgi:hypothetical protein